MFLITYDRHGYGEMQVEEVEADKVDSRHKELANDRLIGNIRVWKLVDPSFK